MKHVSEFKPQDVERKKQAASDGMKAILNELWKEIKANRPSFAGQLKTKEQIQEYLLAFEKAFIANKVGSIEQLQAGLQRFYREDSSFIPTPAQFAIWCREEHNNNLHFKQLEANTQRIKDERRRIGSDTFEQRQKTARDNLKELREIIKK